MKKQKAGKFYNRALNKSDKELMIESMAIILEVQNPPKYLYKKHQLF